MGMECVVEWNWVCGGIGCGSGGMGCRWNGYVMEWGVWQNGVSGMEWGVLISGGFKSIPQKYSS
jgi:hypothetical protein